MRIVQSAGRKRACALIAAFLAPLLPIVLGAPGVANAAPTLATCNHGDAPNTRLGDGSSISGITCDDGRYLLLTKLTSTGLIDTSYGTGGRVTIDSGAGGIAPKWTVLSDGRVVAIGAGSGLPTAWQVRRFTAAGQPDASFSGDGFTSYGPATTMIASKVEVDASDRVVLTFPFTVGTPAAVRFVRFTSGGVLDSSFGGTGVVDREGLSAGYVGSRLLADGRIVWSDHEQYINGVQSAAVGVERLLASGIADVTYGENPAGFTYKALGGITGVFSPEAAIEESGRVTIKARFSSTPDGNTFAMVRFTADGDNDNTFALGGGGGVLIGLNQGRSGPMVLADGSIITWTSFGGSSKQPGIYRFPATGSNQTVIFPDFGPEMAGGTFSVIGAYSGGVYVAGSKVQADGTTTVRIKRILVDPTTGTMSEFNSGASATVTNLSNQVQSLRGTVAANGIVRLGINPVLQFGAFVTVDQDFGRLGRAALIPELVPSPPTGVIGTGNNASALIRWTAPATSAGGPILAYVVQRSIDGGTTFTTAQTTASTATSATIIGLTNGTTYQFRVAALNASGFSLASSNVTVAPLAPPTQTKLSETRTDTLKINDTTVYQQPQADLYQSTTLRILNLRPAESTVVALSPPPDAFTVTAAFDPIVLGTFFADANGALEAEVQIPQLPPGPYILAVIGSESGQGGKTQITIVSQEDGVVPQAATFNALTPTRLFDTRPTDPQGAITVTQQRYGGGNVLKVKVTGVAGVPLTGVGAVSLNVTAIDPVAPGFITVYPCGEKPLAANLNYVTGQIVPNAVAAPISPEGEVCFFSSADTHLVADINGWYAAVRGFNPVTPKRVFDTRPTEAQGAVAVAQQRYGGLNVLKVKVAGIAGVPLTGVGAVSLNVTAIDPVAPGYITVFPCGDLPLAANLNYVTGQIVPNAVIAPVSASGEVCFYSQADTHLVADINGWFGSGQGFEDLAPTRLFDTRPTDPQGAVTVTQQRYGGANVLKIKVTGVAGVPGSGVSAVSLNVTAVSPLGPGFVTVFPCGPRPLAANLNYVTGQIVPNAVIAPVSPSGEVCFFSLADTHLVADINGYFPL